MKVAVDPRRFQVLHPLVGAYRELSFQERAIAVRKARMMLLLEEHEHFRDGIHSSVGHFAERNGATAAQGRLELDLGYALRKFPHLEALVLDGTIPPASAAVIGKVIRRGLERPGDDWVRMAQTRSLRGLNREYWKRLEESMVDEAVFAVTNHLTRTAIRDLARCRVLVARKLDREVTGGIVIGVLAHSYRTLHDPLWRRPGKRRVPPTAGVPGRYVPAQVDREVRARTQDGCQFPVCDNDIWVDRAHHEPHAGTGDREASNLHLLCKRHHRLFDAKRFLIGGTPENPQFFTPDGRRIDARTPYLPGKLARAAERARRAFRRDLAENGPGVAPEQPPGSTPSPFEPPPTAAGPPAA